MFYKYDLFGWYDGSSDEPATRCTEDVPENLSQTTLEGELRSNYTGYEWINIGYTLPNMPISNDVYIPLSVSKFQAKAALLNAGLLDQVEALMIDSNTPNFVKLAWSEAPIFNRDSPTVIAITNELGYSKEQVDMLFISASGIVA